MITSWYPSGISPLKSEVNLPPPPTSPLSSYYSSPLPPSPFSSLLTLHAIFFSSFFFSQPPLPILYLIPFFFSISPRPPLTFILSTSSFTSHHFSLIPLPSLLIALLSYTCLFLFFPFISPPLPPPPFTLLTSSSSHDFMVIRSFQG